MDIPTIVGALTILKNANETIKQAKDMLPESPKKVEVNDALAQAERQLKMAEAETLKTLGYELCRNHIPPEVMLSPDNVNWTCPKCNNKRYTGHSYVSAKIGAKKPRP